MKYDVTTSKSRSLPEISVDLKCLSALKANSNFSLSKKNLSMAASISSNNTFSSLLPLNRLSKKIRPDTEDISKSKENNSQAAQGD